MSRRSQKSSANPHSQPDLFSFAPPSRGSAQSNVPPDRPESEERKQLASLRSQHLKKVEPDRQPCLVQQGRELKPAVEPGARHLLDVRAAAAWLGLSKSTLDKMRCYGIGPRFIRATCRAVRYDPDDLREFAEARRQSPASEG